MMKQYLLRAACLTSEHNFSNTGMIVSNDYPLAYVEKPFKARDGIESFARYIKNGIGDRKPVVAALAEKIFHRGTNSGVWLVIRRWFDYETLGPFSANPSYDWIDDREWRPFHGFKADAVNRQRRYLADKFKEQTSNG